MRTGQWSTSLRCPAETGRRRPGSDLHAHSPGHHPSGNIQSGADLRRPAKQGTNPGIAPLECEQRPRVQSQTSDIVALCHSRPSALSAHARSSALTGPSSRSRSSRSRSRLSSRSARATAVPMKPETDAALPRSTALRIESTCASGRLTAIFRVIPGSCSKSAPDSASSLRSGRSRLARSTNQPPRLGTGLQPR